MPKILDLVGHTFGRFTVIRYLGSRESTGKMYRFWECLCECGNKTELRTGTIRSCQQQSCGCLRKEAGKRREKHGFKKTKTYRVWINMRSRCRNQNSQFYERYGGRGIKIDPSWEEFSNFLNDMGFKPEGMTLERRDNNQGYSKSNCMWATVAQQARNRSSTKLNIDKAKEIQRLLRLGKKRADISDLFGVSRQQIDNIAKDKQWKNIEL